VPVFATAIIALGNRHVPIVGRDFFPIIDVARSSLTSRGAGGTRDEKTSRIFEALREQDPPTSFRRTSGDDVANIGLPFPTL